MVSVGRWFESCRNPFLSLVWSNRDGFALFFYCAAMMRLATSL